MDVDDLIRKLDLQPHPEGGWFRETWRGGPIETPRGARTTSTAIYYLLPKHGWSAWHRVASDEVWHHYRGAPAHLHLMRDDGRHDTILLGSDILNGQRPQATVPAGVWQATEPIDGWALFGCTVAPGFDFDDFELPQVAELRALVPGAGSELERFARRG